MQTKEVTVQTKSAFIAVVGKPNVGKSSLVNRLVGEKIAIVSAKPQTTRTKITGVVTKGNTQFVFFDTPGLHKAKTKLSESMVRKVEESIAEVELAILVTDPTGKINSAEFTLMNNLKEKKIPAILAINKIDTLNQKEEMIRKLTEFSEHFTFDEVIPMSVLRDDGVNILEEKLEKYAVMSPHFFDEDAMTDQIEREIVAEIIREKILNNMFDEVPHGVAVVIEKMSEREGANGPITDIDANIFCERDNHKGMIIGKNGSMLKTIGSQARVELEQFLDIKINLQCWVKVKEDWRNKENVVRNLGF